PEKGRVYNTIVTSELGAVIAESFGMEVKSTLTGFKFIGEQAKLIEDTDYEFMFGYEESYGYVIKDFVRDKDSIQALLLISEIANIGKLKGKTLYDYLLFLYEEYGYYYEDLANIVLEGVEGENRIKEIMNFFRNNHPSRIIGNEVIRVEDFLQSIKYENGKEETINLSKSNVLKFTMSDGSWFVLRPSGTEPKLKIYIAVKDISIKFSKKKNRYIKEEVLKIIDNI
ncbi:MAG: phospho-sugar mutase, partial [Candidatus Izimaplasma sp.]|nr:phospho-sugar mutase [Candidatus Izimaplasma bacterium]